MLAENNEYNKLEEAKPQEKERKELSWVVQYFLTAVGVIGAMMFFYGLVLDNMDNHKQCDACPMDYHEDVPLSSLCRYTPEPHILYDRKCYIARPYKDTAITYSLVGALLGFSALGLALFYDIYVKCKS